MDRGNRRARVGPVYRGGSGRAAKRRHSKRRRDRQSANGFGAHQRGAKDARLLHTEGMKLQVIALAAALVSAAGPTLATTVPPFTESELRAAADVVIDGRVVGSTTRLVGRRIITFVSIVSGSPPQLTTTMVAVPGGVFGDVTQVVPGSPLLEVGVRYRLYLGRADGPRLDDDGVAARGIIGLWRGVFLLGDRGELAPLQPDGRAPTVSPVDGRPTIPTASP
jgi:hypothetical protein